MDNKEILKKYDEKMWSLASKDNDGDKWIEVRNATAILRKCVDEVSSLPNREVKKQPLNEAIESILTKINYNERYRKLEIINACESLESLIEQEVKKRSVELLNNIKKDFDMSDNREWCTYQYMGRNHPTEVTFYTSEELYNSYLKL